MNSPCSNEHEKWFEDAHNLLTIAKTTPGLPLPSISGTSASFNYTGITHAKDTRESVAWAETILSYAFRVQFQRDDPQPVGSSRHYMLTAYLPSGLPLSIVAKAEHFGSQDAREDTPQLVDAA